MSYANGKHGYVPWDWSDGTDEPSPYPNESTPEGRMLGAELARLVPIDGCEDCAFRVGTRANGCATTLMDAIKCIVEGVPFDCHVRPGLCAGYAAAVATEAAL